LLGNLYDYNPAQDRVPVDQLSELDRYAMIRLHRMTERVIRAYDKYEFHIVYQAIHHFCAVEMSAFYLDIIKDRLYVNEPNHPLRKAAQTVLYDALTAITKLIAPILPHTADEVWKYIPAVDLISVQLAEFPEVDTSLYNEELEAKWDRFIAVRDDVLKALEEARKNKLIGNSLGAAVNLYPDAAIAELLSGFSELDQLFIVSAVKVFEPGTPVPAEAMAFKQLSVQIVPAEGEKCERCWIVTPEVGHSQEHPTLCKRCASVIQLIG